MLHYKEILALGAATLLLAACAATETPVVVPTASAPTLVVVAPTATPAIVVPTYTVQRGAMDDVLVLDARVAPLIDQDLFFEQAGVLTNLAVSRDDKVATGQLLAELDHRDLDEKLAEAQRNLDTIMRKLASDQREQQISIQTAQLAVDDAQAKLAKLLQTPTQQDLGKARTAAEQAKINLRSAHTSASLNKTQAQAAIIRAADDLRARQEEYAQVVVKNGGAPSSKLAPAARIEQDKAKRALEEADRSLDLARASYDAAVKDEIDEIQAAEQELAAAQLALKLLEAGPDPLEVEQAKRDITRSQLALQSLNTSSAALATQQEADQAKHEIELQQQAIEATRIYAPFDGVIAETIARSGEKLEEFAPVLTLIDPAKLDLVASQVKRSDLTKVGVGQPAEITFADLPGQTVSGKVSQLPEDTADPQSDLSIRLDFERGDLDLAIGDPASVRMVLQQVPDALWLPPAAVQQSDQRRYVLVKDGQGQREVDVTIGIVTADRLQITSGLAEGDVVLGAVPAK